MPKKREIKDLHKEDKIIEKFNIQTKKIKNKNSPILLNEMKINNELEESFKVEDSVKEVKTEMIEEVKEVNKEVKEVNKEVKEVNKEVKEVNKEVKEVNKEIIEEVNKEEDIIKKIDDEIEKSKIKEELLKKIDFEDEEFMILFIKKFIENYKIKYKDTSNIINSEMNHLIHVLNEYFYL